MISTVLDEGMGSYAKGISGSIYKVSQPKILNKITNSPRLPFRPDRWLLLNNSVSCKARSLLADRNYDCFVTRSQYHSAHLVGLSLKKRFPELPWIACFSDPWSNADHQASIPFFSNWSARQEKKVLELADRLVFPTKGMQAHFTSSQNSWIGRSVILPHSFDPVLSHGSSSKKPAESDSFTLRLFGSFYGTRKPDVLFSAIDQLELEKGQRLTLEIFGPWHNAYENLGGKFPEVSEKKIRYLGQVPHIEALANMREADLLVLVDAPGEGKSMYLPSKLVDYIGSGQPILALCREGVVDTVAKKLGGTVAEPSDVNAVTVALKQWIERRKMPSLRTAGLLEEYKSANVGAKFRAMIDELL